jgi:hypothetical protein
MQHSPYIKAIAWMIGISATFWIVTHALMELRLAMNAWNI